VLLFDQAIFAGSFLSGSYGALLTHEDNARFAAIATLLTLVSSILVAGVGKGPRWPIVAASGLFVLVGLQIVLGYTGMVALHVPVGVATIVVAVVTTVWTWRRV